MKMSNKPMDEMDDILAKYVFLKTGGLNPDIQKKMNEPMEKTAFDPLGVGKTLGWLYGTAKDLFGHTIPLLTMGIGAGTGGLWYILNKELEKERLKSKRSLSAISKSVSEAKEKAKLRQAGLSK